MGTSLLIRRTHRNDVDAPSSGAYIEDRMKLILSRLKKALAYLLTYLLVFTKSAPS
jgi:hypothetical protein